MNWKTQPYTGGKDDEVARLILSIQNGEAGLNLTIADQPDLWDIAASYRDGGFWIAQSDGAVVGTIGLMVVSGFGVVKKLFVRCDFRGRTGPAADLMECLVQEAVRRGMQALVLDTPSVATRSHAFYVKNGFRRIEKSELPIEYAYPDRDSILMRRDLGGSSPRS